MARIRQGLVHHIRGMAALYRADPRDDATLLGAFADTADEGAFAALVVRYGAAVWAGCRRVLASDADAEDAFQATFIALARQAGRLRRDPLGGWLQTTARRAALNVLTAAGRRDAALRRLADLTATRPESPLPVDELRAAVSEELARLPEKLRVPVALYYLDGQTQAEVAQVVGVSDRAVAGRLDRGLALLRERLGSRGLVVAAAALIAVLGGMPVTSAAPPTGLTALAVEAGVQAVQGGIVRGVAGAVAANLGPARCTAPLLMVAGLLVVTGLAVATALAVPARPPAPAAVAPASPKEEPAAVRPIVALTGRVVDPTGHPVPRATVTALVRRPWLPNDRGLRDEPLVQATADADGRYALAVPADFSTHYPERGVTLLVVAPGHPPATRSVVLKPGCIDLSVSAGRTVCGVLAGPAGRPADGVRVGVVRLGAAAAEPVLGANTPAPDGWPAAVHSQADGSFAISGLPATETVWLEVRDERFARTTIRVAPNDLDPVHVALASPRLLHGTVTASDTGEPLAGARVGVFAGPWNSHHDRYTAMTAAAAAAADTPPTEFDAVTAADGTFRLPLPADGPYRVSVHPPPGAAYLAVGRAVDWKPDQTAHALSVVLPSGEVLRGVLRDDAGHPVADGWVSYLPKCGNRHAPKDMLTGRDAPARTAADGSFRLVVPPGEGRVQAFGPHPNFLPATYSPARCPVCNAHHLRTFEYARADIEVPVGRGPEPLALAVKRGEVVRGKVIGPDGKPVPTAVTVCRSVVQPLRDLVPRPIPVRDGAFELPGCSPGRVYPVVVLDPERQLAAVAEVRVGGDPPVVQLEACGTAAVRLVDPAGRPIAGVPAQVGLTLGCDYPAADGPPAKPGAGPVDQSWFDPDHHLPSQQTDADGRVTLRALVPGGEYAVRFEVNGKLYTSAAFRVKAGQASRLPDVVAGVVPTDKPKDPPVGH